MKEILKQEIFDQRDKKGINPYVIREIAPFILTSREIIVISGIRRCGKSVLLDQIRDKNIEKYYYLNFDDERLIYF
jgi:uncharacterized protein